MVDPAKAEVGAELVAIAGDRVVDTWTEVVQHIPVQLAESARQKARDLQVDCILSIGGGSAIGVGKAIRMEVDATFVAVPTTFAGSEMTTIWGMSDNEGKHTGKSAKVKPDFVIYDPQLVIGISPIVAGPSGMNALAHCVEALYGPGANPVTSLLARQGIRSITRNLTAACDHPDDIDAIGEVLYGACLAGIALDSAGTSLHHKACHVLGGMFNLDHGGMNAVLLPHVVAFNAPAMPEVVRALAEELNDEDPTSALLDLSSGIGAPASLQELGMSEAGIESAAEQIVVETPHNPRPLDVESVVTLLEGAFEGPRQHRKRVMDDQSL